MPRLRTATAVTTALALVTFGVLACSDSSGSNNGPNCLNTIVGTYDLDSIEITPPGGVIPAPPASGTFEARNDTLYVANFTLPGPTAIYDSGSYCLTGNGNFVENSFLNPVQFTGTATLTLGELAVSVTGAGQTVSVWGTKQ